MKFQKAELERKSQKQPEKNETCRGDNTKMTAEFFLETMQARSQRGDVFKIVKEAVNLDFYYSAKISFKHEGNIVFKTPTEWHYKKCERKFFKKKENDVRWKAGFTKSGEEYWKWTWNIHR